MSPPLIASLKCIRHGAYPWADMMEDAHKALLTLKVPAQLRSFLTQKRQPALHDSQCCTFHCFNGKADAQVQP
eukprot:CAMPEP_0174314752 /NCGR_PEP_ID=MMETSP0810-20121108/5845_1 /TAXON_ID=73025 ORGANISM="Eutreptiella gymnastica-like, Strain CCMP1594" /NCGR_SAMPLE_ID=MMETSP0810 /ASSEMBLY_ACC=CAM_ASM_000659 /LENGTH=72 /DNA_ID=CAMNT_0015423941 /DNA_START=1235 /DNA_END=1453 /DNA_ORIENTATION=+